MTTSPALRVAPPHPTHDIDALCQLLAETWDWERPPEYYRDHYLGRQNHYDWDVSRLLWEGEQLRTHWGVWKYTMRIGSARVQAGGIGAVATHFKHWNQGLMTRAGWASLEAMQAAGYDLTIIHGYTRNYARFGYVRAWHKTSYEVATADLPVPPTPLALQAIDLNTNLEAHSLYNRTHADYTGTAVRPTFGSLLAGERKAFGWYDPDGVLLGYLRVAPSDEPETLRCLEVVGETEQAVAALVTVANQYQAAHLRLETIPHNHPVLAALRRYRGRAVTFYDNINGWQVRLLNLTTTLEKMAPELTDRLAQSGYADWRGALLLGAADAQATLVIEGGRVTVGPPEPSPHSILGDHHLAQFLLGTDSPSTILANHPMTLTGDAPRLAEALFPAQHPVLSEWDEF